MAKHGTTSGNYSGDRYYDHHHDINKIKRLSEMICHGKKCNFIRQVSKLTKVSKAEKNNDRVAIDYELTHPVSSRTKYLTLL